MLFRSSEIITNLVNSVDGAGLRLANQGYISCADVSANRFGTNDFSVEFVLSQETNAVNADIFISNLNGSNQAVDAAVIRWDVVQNDNIQLVFTNSGASETAYNFGYDPAPDLNEPTHYLVSADRSGNAVLYRNGAEIASVSIAASGSANVGNSGQPTVIGSPVNNFGVKGNVYRLRTYSKALSSDEAKNVFDRADVPTALVSNLLLDLDCAYANPTQSTVIQDRGPNNQDGTLNGTITQTNVIKQGNLTSLAVSSATARTPADGVIIADKLGVGIAPSHAATIYGTGAGNATLQIEGEGGADPTINFLTNNTTHWALGVDDSDSDKFKIVQHSAIGATNNFLNIDTSGKVGIGVSPSSLLHVSGDSNSNGGELTLQVNNNNTTDNIGTINFGNNVDSSLSMIQSSTSGNNTSSDLSFHTSATGTQAARLTIDSSGTVKVGSAHSNEDQTSSLIISKSIASSGTHDYITLADTSNNGTEKLRLLFKGRYATGSHANGQEAAYISCNRDAGSDGYGLSFGTGDAADAVDRLTISRTGLATFSAGISFTQTNSSTAGSILTTLDHYEQGHFTATLNGGTAEPATLVTSNANYTRVGDRVFFSIGFENADTTGYSGAITISGLPFANAGVVRAPISVITYDSATWTSGSQAAAFIGRNHSYVSMYAFESGGVWNALQHDAGTGRYFWLNGTYRTAAA